MRGGPVWEAGFLRLQGLEERLRTLDSFLREYQERRRLRAQRQPTSSSASTDPARGSYFDAGPPGGGGGGSQAPPAKRQRLAEAAKLEDQRCGGIAARPAHVMHPTVASLLGTAKVGLHLGTCCSTCLAADPCVQARQDQLVSLVFQEVLEMQHDAWYIGHVVIARGALRGSLGLEFVLCETYSLQLLRRQMRALVLPEFFSGVDDEHSPACRVGAVRALVARAAEGCFLLRTLGDHNLGRLAARCDDSTQRSLRDGLKLRDWVTAANGEAVAASLISVLITKHLSATGAAPFSTVHPLWTPAVVVHTCQHAKTLSFCGQSEVLCITSAEERC